MHKFLDNSVVWFIIYFLLIVVHECVPKSSCKQISNQVVCGSMIFLPVLNYYGLNLLDHLYMHCAVLMFIFYSWTPYKQQRGLFPTLGSSWPKHFAEYFCVIKQMSWPSRSCHMSGYVPSCIDIFICTHELAPTISSGLIRLESFVEPVAVLC